MLIFIVMVFWRPQEWLVPALYGLPILDAVVYMSLLSFLLEKDSGTLKINFREPQYLMLVGLFVAALMSHISHTYFAGLMNTWITMFRLCFFGIILFSSISSVSDLRWVARVYVVMALFMVVHALLQQSRGYGFGGLRPIMSWRPGLDYKVPRSLFFGIFGDPNDMGQFIATSIPFAFVLLKRLTFFTFMIGCGISYYMWLGIETTWSRGSQIGCIVALLVVVALFIAKKKPLKFLILGCVCGLALLPLSGRFMEGSAYDRIDFWGQANWAFKESPIFGVGTGMIRDYVEGGHVPHNAYVSCYSEVGLFGFFFWFSLLFLAFLGLVQTRMALRGCKEAEGKWLYSFSGWGLASLSGLAVSSYFLSRAFVFPTFFMTAMMGSVPILARKYVDDPDKKLGFTIKQTCQIGIPLSVLVVIYVYVSILILNATR